MRRCQSCKKKHFLEPSSIQKYKICDYCGWEFTYDQSLPVECGDDNDRTTNQYAQIDSVNHPEHYAGTVECIDAMEACATPEQFIGYCRLCAFKYLWRAGKKGDALTDYKKAIWYLERLVKAMEAK